jgi:thiol-disulfide isomerase/thioredoxin
MRHRHAQHGSASHAVGRAVLAATLVAAAVMTARPARAQDVGLGIGAMPKPVTIQDLNGKAVDLATYLGRKPVLLEFWATWCPLCRAMEPRMQKAYGTYGGRVAFLIIAVGVNQSPSSVKRFLGEHAIAGRVLWDTDGRAVRAFDAPATSYVVILDDKGRVSYTGSGADQDIAGALAHVVSASAASEP